MRTAVGDHTTGLATLSGILAALFERERTGKGRLVETSLLRTGIYALGSDMAIQLALGKVGSTRPRENALNPLNNFYKTRDDNWLVLLTRHSGSQDWQRLMQAVGREDLGSDPRFQNTALRRDNGPALIAALDEAFATRDLEEWADILDEIDIVWAPVQTPAQVAADPQAEAAGAFVDVRGDDGSVVRSVAPPVRFDGADTAEYHTAPTAGAHTDEILAGLGFAPDAIADLRARRVIG
jgi:crotonobetainyl-CoA:carnitine CoA-transferase CaiB-like acyl-CoA transferase